LRTKIVATIGPASRRWTRSTPWPNSAVDVVRLNFAHGTHESHREVIQWVREAAEMIGKPLAILADLAGPKIRIGALPAPIDLNDKSTVILAPEEIASATRSPRPTPRWPTTCSPATAILLDDGIMELRVVAVQHPRVSVQRVVRGGLLKQNKGMNLPGIRVSAHRR
jgi:pyruvate kinase